MAQMRTVWLKRGIVVGLTVVLSEPLWAGPLRSPTNLTATASSNTVTLSWNDRSTAEQDFVVERSTVSSSSGFTVVATVPANTIRYPDATVAPATTYYYRVSAHSSTGGLATSGAISVTTPPTEESAPPPDTTAPVVSMTSPSDGAILSGVVSLSATASDNVGVTKVEFYRDGSVFLGAALYSPYTIALDTATVPNGTHTFLAKASDAAGQVTTSSPVTAAVNNAAAALLLNESFDRPNGLITNEYAYWNPTDPAAYRSSVWELTSGSLFADSQTGWTGVPDARTPTVDSCNGLCTNSARFRLTTIATFGNVAVSFRLLNQGLTSTSVTPAVAWDGVHVFLRYQNPYALYYASVNRRDNTVVIKKKVTDAKHTGPSGGGWYCDISPSASYPVPYGTWQQVEATVRNATDGSVVMTLSANGKLLVSATDRGGSCGGLTDPAWTGPITNAGKIGVRGDNANFRIDDVVVRSVD